MENIMGNQNKKAVVVYQANEMNFQDLNIQLVRSIMNQQCLTPLFLIVLPKELKDTETQTPEDVKLLFHDNSSREFSAWEEGLLFIRNTLGHDYVLYVFLNETFTRHHVIDEAFLRGLVKPLQFISSTNTPYALGDIDVIDCRPPYYDNSLIPFYLSTYFFVLNSECFKILSSFVVKDLLGEFNLARNKKSVFIQGAKLRLIEYGHYLEELFYHPSRRKYKWWGHSSLSINNYDFLSLKCYSVILEHQLSQRLIANGAFLLDIKTFIFRSRFSRIKNSLISGLRRIIRRWCRK